MNKKQMKDWLNLHWLPASKTCQKVMSIGTTNNGFYTLVKYINERNQVDEVSFLTSEMTKKNIKQDYF